jgi:hypothetical protein
MVRSVGHPVHYIYIYIYIYMSSNSETVIAAQRDQTFLMKENIIKSRKTTLTFYIIRLT